MLYKGSLQWKEVAKLANDYLHNSLGVEFVYAHVVKENNASIKWHVKWVYIRCLDFKFPKEKYVNGIEQIEFFRDKLMYKETV